MLTALIGKSKPGRGHTQAVPPAPIGTSETVKPGVMIPGKYYHIVYVRSGQERLLQLLTLDHGEYATSVLAVKIRIGDDWQWSIEQTSEPVHMSQGVLDQIEVPIKEVDPKDFPLYVGWAYVSPRLAQLIKNL
jgi:hypothetical protein